WAAAVPAVITLSLCLIGEPEAIAPGGALANTPAANAPGPAGEQEALVLPNATGSTAAAAAPGPYAAALLRDGELARDAPASAVEVPAGAEERDLKGAVVIPGLVDTHSHIGVWSRPGSPGGSDTNEMSGPVQSGVRALDSIFPDDPGIRMAVAGGVTTANIM